MRNKLRAINRKINWKREWKIMVGEIAGSFLAAIGAVNFAVSLNVPMTGVTGVAMIIYRLTGFPLGWMSLILNIPLALLCRKVIGRRFLFRSLRCMLILSVMMDYVAPILPVYNGDRMLAAVCAGAFMGVGYGLIYRQNSSSGGSDFISVAIKSRFPHITMGTIEFCAAAIVLIASALIFNDVDGIILGLIISFISSEMINRLLIGANEGTVNLIVTDHPRETCDMIDEVLGRGSTIIEASGGYQGDRRSMVFCVTDCKQVATLQETLQKNDPTSFSVQIPCSEVHGEGFRFFSLGRSDG
jgi:uncharacterized membrane-anchored protein YitT (DUF2179 family)